MAGIFDTGANALLGIGQNTVQPQVNQLQNIAAAQNIKNQALDYTKNALALGAKKAEGAAYAHNYNALTGEYNMPGVQAEMAKSSAGQYGLPEAVTTIRSQQGQQTSNDAAQLGLNQRRTGMLAGLAAPLMSNPNVTKGDVARQLGVGVAHGLITMDQAQSAYSALPDDSDGIKQQVRGLMDASIGPEHSYNDAYGEMRLVDDGNVLRWENVGSPASGQGGVQVGAGVEKQVSPEFNYAPVTITGPDGTPRIVPRGQVVGSAKPTVPSEVMGSGRYPNTQPTSAENSSSPQQGGYVVGPPAGQVQAQQTTAEASAKAANALMDAAAQRNDRLSMLGNMASDLTGFSSGPGYERLRKAAAFFDNWTGAGLMSSQIESAQGFNKWAQQLANAQAQALGASDARLGAAEHANPNSGLQEGTNRMMIHQLMGNEEAINAKAQAWQASGLPASQYQQWNQKFSQNFDPRAFQLLKMTPEEQQTMFKGMKASGQFDAFKKTYNAMAAAGLVPSGR